MKGLQGLAFGVATVVLVVVATYLFADDWLPPLASDRVGIDTAIWWSLMVTGVVFIITNLLLAFFTWRFRERDGENAAYWHDDPKLEWTWTLATAGVMMIFAFGALNLWADIRRDPPADAMVVEVTGQQFRWVVRYPGPDGEFARTEANLVDVAKENYLGADPDDPAGADDVARINELYLIENRPVVVRIRSTDVIHSFFLPNFRVKQDAMPGLVTSTWFVPTKSGDFEIACAEHCGLGHYRMRGFVHVVSQQEFREQVGY